MKLQRSTLVLLITAIALSGSVLIYESQRTGDADSDVAAQDTEAPLFAFTEADIQELFIERLDAEILLENTTSGWLMRAPQKATAEPAAVVYLLDFLTSKPTRRTLTVPADDLAEFGLDDPRATVEIKLANGKTHQLRLGAPEFSGNTLYVQTSAPDAETGDPVTIYTISSGLTSAVNRPAEDWLTVEPTADEPTGTETQP